MVPWSRLRRRSFPWGRRLHPGGHEAGCRKLGDAGRVSSFESGGSNNLDWVLTMGLGVATGRLWGPGIGDC